MTRIRHNFLECFAVKEDGSVGCSAYLAGDRIIFSSFSFNKRASFNTLVAKDPSCEEKIQFGFRNMNCQSTCFFPSTEVFVVTRYWKMLAHLDMVYCFSPCLFPHPYTMLTRPFPSSCPGLNTLIVMGAKYCQPISVTLLTNQLTNAMGQNHSWAGNGFLPSPEISCIVWTLLLQSSCSLGPFLSQIISVHILPS